MMPKVIAFTTQSSETILGCCYGYSSFWAKGKLSIEKDESNSTYEIPLNPAIVCEQLSQIYPSQAKRLTKFYVNYWDTEEFIADLKLGLKNDNDAVIIGYSGLIGGHALAVKKISDNKYQFFDCNTFTLELNEGELGKIFRYMRPLYHKVFYGLTMDYVPANTNELSPNYESENVWATAYILLCKIASSPLGIIRYLHTFVELIIEGLGTLIESNEKSETSSLIRP